MNIQRESHRQEDVHAENMTEMYTVKNIQSIFKCSPAHAYGLVNSDGFPSIRIGKKILVERLALEKWIDKNRGRTINIT